MFKALTSDGMYSSEITVVVVDFEQIVIKQAEHNMYYSIRIYMKESMRITYRDDQWKKPSRTVYGWPASFCHFINDIGMSPGFRHQKMPKAEKKRFGTHCACMVNACWFCYIKQFFKIIKCVKQ